MDVELRRAGAVVPVEDKHTTDYKRNSIKVYATTSGIHEDITLNTDGDTFSVSKILTISIV